MRPTWHIVAQLTFVGVGCAGSEEGQEPAGNAIPRECSKINVTMNGVDPVPTIPTVRETYKGQNGQFTDRCEAGNLVQYACERQSMQGPPGDPTTWTSASGNVEPLMYDCGGRCVNGACPDVCPAIRDQLRYVSIDQIGSATFESLATGFTYTCWLRGTAEGFDCTTTPKPGDLVNVTSAAACVDLAAFWTGTGSALECDYSPCSVALP